jgi:hypothetical protein
MDGEGRFEPLRTRAHVAVALIVSVCATHVVALAADTTAVLGWGDLDGFELAIELGDGAAALLALGAGLVAILSIVLFFVSAVTYCMWLHRAAANARVFSDTFTTTPGEAVAAHFIPFVNLYKPKAVMDAIHQASDPDGALPPGDVTAWWAAWIISNLLAYVEMRFADDAGGTTSIALSYVGEGLFLLATILLSRIVLRVTDFQERRAARLATDATV